MKLLNAFNGRWTMNLFHYQGQVVLNILLAHWSLNYAKAQFILIIFIKLICSFRYCFSHKNMCCPHFQGESGGNVLMGLQVVSSEMDEFKALADTLGCDYAFETSNRALQLQLH